MDNLVLGRYYTREDLITRLQKMGVLPKLLKMPAVIERILDDYPNLETIRVDVNGNIEYKGKNGHLRGFELKDDGTVKSEIVVWPTLIDKYGMEIESKEGTRDRNYIFLGVHAGERCARYDNYPGWEIGAVRRASKSQYTQIMGHVLFEYPQTEEWFVEQGFLSPEKDARDNQIAAALKETEGLLRDLLRKTKEDLEFARKTYRRPGVLEVLFGLSGPSSIEKIVLLEKNIELYTQSIARCKEYQDLYQNGGRPEDDTKYSEEQAQENRLVFFREETEEYRKKTQRVTIQNEQRAEKLSKLQELARKCAKIPFTGKKVASVITEQIQLLEAEKGKKKNNYRRRF